MEKRNIKQVNLKILTIIVFAILALLSFFTSYEGSADTSSFKSPAKYFAGEYPAKIRNSHSYLWGFVNSFHVRIFNSFIGFKIVGLIILFLIVLSTYYISKKDKRVFLLMLFSPIIWYMAPWINSIQIAGLLFLWCYYFIEKFDKSNNIKDLFYSGILFGLVATVWHAILYLGVFFILFYFYNKKFIHVIYYVIAILVGLLPLFILDFWLFGFPLHTLLKNTAGSFFNLFQAGLNPNIGARRTLSALIFLFLAIPIYFWKLYNKKDFIKNHKIMLFINLVLIIILKNPQIRYLLLVVPIMILLVTPKLNKKQFKILLIMSLVVGLIALIPYEIQIKYKMNGDDIKTMLESFPDLGLTPIFPEKLIEEDLSEITTDYPNEVFIVGNKADDYQVLANIYWGEDVEEFVSIQDYNLFISNKTSILEKEFRSSPKNLYGRREIWIAGGISKPADLTDYESIEYAISIGEALDLKDFELVEEYQILRLYERL